MMASRFEAPRHSLYAVGSSLLYADLPAAALDPI
jgi:hypothetical protein